MRQLILLLFTAATAMAAPAAEGTLPRPYEASYSVSYRGISAGQVHFELRAEEDGRYVYASHADPNLIARLVVSRDAVERSVMEIGSEGVRPLSWFKEDGKSGNEDDGMVEFDWQEGVVSGMVEGEYIEMELVPELQDHLSIQIAVMTSLLNDCEPGTIPMLSGDRIKRYSYTKGATTPIKTGAGTFKAVLYEVTRPGSSRLSRIWHAPELGFIPVRAEQLRDGTLETVIELDRVRRTEAREAAPG